MTVLPYVCLLVNNVERAADFIIEICGCYADQADIVHKPVLHRVVRVSNELSITIVQINSCCEAALATFSLYAVKDIFIAVQDFEKVHSTAQSLGAQVVKDTVTDGIKIRLPDGDNLITIHAVDVKMERQNPHDLIMNAMMPQSNNEHGISNGIASTAVVEVPDKAKRAHKNLNPRPIIPTMAVSVLSNNSKSYVACPPNSREATPFETEIFLGSALLICRTDPEDAHYKAFFTGKRVFELQVQGQFKRLPQGEIVVGGESTNKMELGLIMRSICKAVCNFGSSIISDLHYSFGDVQSTPDYQLPHMSAPLFSTMDKLIVTLPGGALPKMGEPFQEDPEHRKKRMRYKNIEDACIKIGNTYSFSVASSNIDFCKWCTVGIPMVKPMDLRTFWGDSDLRLVAYEIPKAVRDKYPNKHPQTMVNYLLNIKLQGLDPDKPVEITLDASDEYDEEDKEDPSLSQGATPPELTPRSITEETPLEVKQDAADSDYSLSPGRGKTSASPMKIGMEKKGVKGQGRGGRKRRARGQGYGLSPKHSSDEGNGEGGDEEEDDEEEDEEEEEDDKSLNYMIDEEDDDDDDEDGDEGFGLDTVTEAMLLAKVQQKQNRAKVARKVSMLSLLLPGDGDRDVALGGDHGTGSPSGGNFSRNVGSWFRRRVGKGEDTKTGEVRESTKFYPSDFKMESEGDLRYCPACIETNDRRRDGRRRMLFVMPWESETDGVQMRLRSYTEICFALLIQPIMKTHKTKKLSIEEKRRIQVLESFRAACSSSPSDAVTEGSLPPSPHKDRDPTPLGGSSPPSSSSSASSSIPLPSATSNTASASSSSSSHASGATTSATTSPAAVVPTYSPQLKALLSLPNDTDTNFLGGFVSVRRIKGKVGMERWEGSVAMATSRRHWTEQSMQITKTEVLLRRNHDAIRVSLRIPLKTISKVRAMPKDGLPFPGFSYFAIETFSRVHYFMVRSDRQLQEWLKAYEGLDPPAAPEQDSFYLARPPCWKLDKRRLFNYRRIVFSAASLPPDLRDMAAVPLTLIESILRKALKLSILVSDQTLGSFSAEDVTLWGSFLDELSVLQIVNITALPQKERAVFFLNLYHVMVIHGSLVIGPPPSWSSWPSFFNNIAYLLSFDVVGIAEVEHNLLRAEMSRPNTLLSKIPSPPSLFPEMALQQRDFRLNFCINSGSLSMLPYVPVYTLATFDSQLDEMTSRFLEDSVEIDLTKRIVTLPKHCHWYPSDFSSRRHGQQHTHTNANTNAHTHSSSNSHPQGGLNGAQGGPGPTPVTSPLLSPPTPAPSSLAHFGPHNTVTSYGPVPTPTPIDCLKVIVHYLKREEKEKILRLLFENSPPIIKFKKFNYRCRILISEKDCFKKVLLNGSFGALQDGMQGLSSEEKDAVGTI